MWTTLVVLLVASGAISLWDYPDRTRRQAIERRAVLDALVGLRSHATATRIAREIADRTGMRLSDRIVWAQLTALEEDGILAVEIGAAGSAPRYRLVVHPQAELASRTMDTPSPLTVYHDGTCPLCAAEIGHYKRARGGQALTFEDVADTPPREDDLTREAALARFHVRDGSGTLLSGAAAFAALWRTLPGWRWLGRIVGARPILPLAELGYRAFLPLRPRLASALVALGILKPARRS